uniref:OmpA family protein n=1 Tax=uncultured Acinetobacter sp. TaxID=165433 RepID=UPI00261B2179|nr:OmpA family protein [uncultured Acinetobacter sp.]
MNKQAMNKTAMKQSALIIAMSLGLMTLYVDAVMAAELDAINEDNFPTDIASSTVAQSSVIAPSANPVVSLTSTAPELSAEKKLTTIARPVIDETQHIANPQDQVVAAMQQRLLPFFEDKKSIQYYHAKKAATWLTYAAHEGSERGFIKNTRKEALAEAERIITALEQGLAEELSLTTNVLSMSGVMRRDLWATAEVLKHHEGFNTSYAETAQAEVTLVWAVAEHCELGWRHSREKFLSAQRLLDRATYQVLIVNPNAPQELPKVTYPSLEELNGGEKACNGVKGQWPIWTPAVVAPVVIPEPEPTVLDEFETEEAIKFGKIPNVVHFGLDQSNITDESAVILNKIIRFMNKYPDHTMTLYGFTDLRASVVYNLRLSKKRVNAVASYLIEHGIAESRIAMEAEGETQLIDNDEAKMGHALSRRVELVYVDPEGKEVKTYRQTADLQLED